MASSYDWKIETYRPNYLVIRLSDGSPYIYPHMVLSTDNFGSNARVSLVFLENPPTGTVDLPSFQGLDIDYHYSLFLPRDQFGTVREFLDSERPIRFIAYHNSSPQNSTQNVEHWTLTTSIEEPVGEEERESITSRYLDVVPEEALTDDLLEAREAVNSDSTGDGSDSQAGIP